MRKYKDRALAFLIGMLIAALGVELYAQNMKLADGTIAVKSVLYDINGAPVSVGGGTQYSEDTVAGAADQLNMAGVIQVAACGTAAAATGDRTVLQVSSTGVLCTSSTGGGGGAAQADNTALSDITGSGALYDTTPPTITDGNVGLPRMDSSRYQYTVFPTAQAVTASAGTNLNTSALALETGGNLASIATSASSSNTLLGTISSTLTSILARITDTDDNTDALEGYLDNVETLLGTINTAVQLSDDAVYVIDGDITNESSKFALTGCWYQSAPVSTEDNDGSPFLCDVNGRLLVSGTFSASLEDEGMDPITDDTSNSMRALLVDSTGTPIAYSDIYIEDAAAPANPEGPPIILLRDADLSNSVTTEGDWITASADARGLMFTRNADPCSALAKQYFTVDITTATTTEITPSLSGASNYWHICAIDLVTTAANNVNLVDDNTDGCGSVTASLMSTGLAAGDGWGFGANGGLTKGSGIGAVMRSVTTNAVLCLVTSAATELHGSIAAVAAP